MTTDLFYGNTFVLFLIFVISVFTMDKLSEKQKIALVYIASYGIAWGESMPERLLLILMTAILFLVQEYFTLDRKKLKILKRIHYKVVDFTYMGMFQYKLPLIYIAICIRTTSVKLMLGYKDVFFDGISLVIFLLAFVWIFDTTEEFYTFTEMYDKVWETPYRGITFDRDLKERLEIITLFEDELYWERKKAYSSCSLEFIVVWIKNHKCPKYIGVKRSLSFRAKIKRLMGMPHKIWVKFKTLMRWVIRNAKRGHSTIPMQLIRILGYRHGLVFGRTKIKFKRYKIFKRKIYEILYSRMFFEGLKEYLKVELCNNLEHYREYVVYLYPQIVQTTIDGKVFAPAKKAFITEDEDNKFLKMNEWDIDLVIRMCFGFNGMDITEKRMNEKKELIQKYGFKNNLND